MLLSCGWVDPGQAKRGANLGRRASIECDSQFETSRLARHLVNDRCYDICQKD